VWTIEAGTIGNEKPIVITSERWYAPDLLVVVYSRDFDPRFGETVYRLDSLRRGEPAADLFKVPADFVVTNPAAPAKAAPQGAPVPAGHG
jgi:hypothetical protein